MDALTTSSADHRETGSGSGRSAEANAVPRTESQGHDQGSGQVDGQGDWSWFAPTQPRSTTEPHQRAADGEESDAPRRVPSQIRPVGARGSEQQRPDAAWDDPHVPGAQEEAPAASWFSPGSAAPTPGPGGPEGPAATVPRQPSAPTGEYQADDTPAPGQGSWFEPTSEATPQKPAAGTARPAPPDAPAAPPQAAASVFEEAQASPDAILIRRAMAAIEPVADKTTAYFYALLFLQHPELRDLFPAAMDAQRDRLFKALLTAAKLVDDADVLTEYLSHLGRGHRKYGTKPEHYPAVGECLIGALTRYASDVWSAQMEAAWVRAYTAISQIMIDAAAADERSAPAWWEAEIVSHERRTHDIAVITVRPDQPYPFLAGQYTSLETPWWPRVWRHYSFASAPRPDGLLSFHIKAVPAGWVSSALVNRARTGDVIKLGPPGGSMTVDHGTDNGLLCLGGGTGIAPIKAMVEDVAKHGRKRVMEVFYGARNDRDLYDLDTMQRLEQQHSWLSVRPVVSDGPTDGLAGQLPEMVRKYGPWHSYDAYLSGPPGMIRSGVDALVGIGMPYDRIRHDSLEELVAAGD